jgi:hypothetical protein
MKLSYSVAMAYGRTLSGREIPNLYRSTSDPIEVQTDWLKMTNLSVHLICITYA